MAVCKSGSGSGLMAVEEGGGGLAVNREADARGSEKGDLRML